MRKRDKGKKRQRDKERRKGPQKQSPTYIRQTNEKTKGVYEGSSTKTWVKRERIQREKKGGVVSQQKKGRDQKGTQEEGKKSREEGRTRSRRDERGEEEYVHKGRSVKIGQERKVSQYGLEQDNNPKQWGERKGQDNLTRKERGGGDL